MAVAEEKDGVLATAAVAAAAGAAVDGLKKALESGNNSPKALARRDSDDDDGDEVEDGGRSLASGLLDTVWDPPSDAIVPRAEEAADAAGKWVAENSPDLIRERIIPRFIESFTEAA